MSLDNLARRDIEDRAPLMFGDSLRHAPLPAAMQKQAEDTAKPVIPPGDAGKYVIDRRAKFGGVGVDEGRSGMLHRANPMTGAIIAAKEDATVVSSGLDD